MKNAIESICVFCGASMGSDPKYKKAAEALAQAMVERKKKLVYGGGNVGLMGVVAHAVFDGLGKGSVYGVIPEVPVTTSTRLV